MITISICCIALTVVCLCKCRSINAHDDDAMVDKMYKTRVDVTANGDGDDTVTSLQICRIDPSIGQFSPSIWTHDTMNRAMHTLHPSPFQSNRCCKPSISQFSHQTIMKSA